MTVDETNRSVPRCDDHDGVQWLFASSGLVAPIFFASMVIVLGLLEPGYSHRTETMSILGGVGGLRGVAFNVGSALTGLLLIAFAIGLHREIGGGEGSRVGPVLIVLGGVGMVGSAIFHCNLDCANVLERPTFAGRMHIVTSFMVGSCLAIAPLAMFARLGKDQRWKNYRWFTLAMGVLANIPGLILWTSFLTTRMPEWEGLIQRLGIVFPLLWVEVMAIHLLRLSLPGGVGKRGKESLQGQL
jgi:hypothetical membrane protein